MAQTRTKKHRLALWTLCRKQKYRCYYCPQKIRPNDSGDCKHHKHTATIDHFIPVSRGGTNSAKNKVAACVDCNNKKKDMYPVDFWANREETNHYGKCETGQPYTSTGMGKAPAQIQAGILETGKKSAAAQRAQAVGRMIDERL